jgi:uncharacterized protein YrrD
MSVIRLSREYHGKPVVSVTTGEIIASVSDVMIDPKSIRAAALVISHGGLLKPTTELIPDRDIQVWGEDVILVSKSDVTKKREALPEEANWLQVGTQLSGRQVISTDGARIGRLNDVVMDTNGRVIGYDLAEVDMEGPVAETKRIAVEATQAFGQDVLIVDASRMEGSFNLG